MRAAWSVACAVLLAACLIRLWIMPLGSSLWVDEMGTAFVVTHGPHDPTLAVAPQVPASIYYVLPWLSTAILGRSEIVYRVPSVLALGLALFLVARLARRLVHSRAAWLAVFGCLALKGFDYEAADARPYALGTAVACIAVWALVRWLDFGRLREALLFVASASLLWYVHLLYWPFYLLFGIYGLWRAPRRVMVPFAAVAVLLIPAALEALALRREAGAHVMTALPGFRALLDSLKPGLAIVPLIVAAVVRRRKLEPSSAVLILAWWLVTPLALFAFSRLTGNSVFLERYLSLLLPGAALAAVAAASVWMPAKWWKPASAATGVAVLLLLGRWNALWPQHHPSDWRGAAAAVNASIDAATPVLCPSPFLEARPPAWRPRYPPDSFLYSNLVVYPVRGSVVTLPFEVEPVALPAGRFILYGGGRNAERWLEWLRQERPGWSVHSLGRFGDVVAVGFEPPVSLRVPIACAHRGAAVHALEGN